MGLIKAAIQATSATLNAQYKEYIYCPAIADDVLMMAGIRNNSSLVENGARNTNEISNGSVVAVADGQAMMIVQGGKICEFTSEPGIFVVNTDSPSIFTTGLNGQGIKELFGRIGERISFGGGGDRDHRCYFFNTKEIMNNAFGAGGIQMECRNLTSGQTNSYTVSCRGTYSFRITNPMAFYTKIAGNIQAQYKKEQLTTQLKSELIDKLGVAFSQVGATGATPTQLTLKKQEAKDAVNSALEQLWKEKRGIEVVSFNIENVGMSAEDMKAQKELERDSNYKDSALQQAGIAKAQMDMMRGLGQNGNMMGAMGLGMMGMMPNMQGGMGVGAAQMQQPAQQHQQAQGWTCQCGTVNQGKFCQNCGQPQPAPAQGKFCPNCGQAVQGNFCQNCGTKVG